MDGLGTFEETLESESPTGLVLHGRLVRRHGADRLVCFMPAAISASVSRDPRQLSRFSWHSEIPEYHVLALSDPALGLDDEILGAWYLHPTADLMQEMAAIVKDLVADLGLDNHQVLFYGSSLGGFGALGMASLLPGSSAIAEIPQIDVACWPVSGAVRAMEDRILGMSFREFRQTYPEMVDVRDRFAKSGLVPRFLLVSNEEDASLEIQKAFMDDIDSSSLPRVGRQRLLVTPQVSGHRALSRHLALGLIRGWASEPEVDSAKWYGAELLPG